jgi:hypothetical protein
MLSQLSYTPVSNWIGCFSQPTRLSYPSSPNSAVVKPFLSKPRTPAKPNNSSRYRLAAAAIPITPSKLEIPLSGNPTECRSAHAWIRTTDLVVISDAL